MMRTFMIISILLVLVISLSFIIADVAVAGDERPFIGRRAVIDREFDEDFGKIIIVRERPVVRFFNPFLFEKVLFFEEEEDDFFGIEKRPFFERERFERDD